MHCYLRQREDTGIWYIWQYDDQTGRVSKRSTRTRDRAAAEKALAKHILSDPGQRKLDDPLLIDVISRYWELYAKSTFGAGAVKTVLARLVDLMPSATVSQFGAVKQQEFVAGLGATTAKRYLGQVFAALNWANNREEIQAPPRKMKLEAQDADGARPLTMEQLRALCEASTTKRQRLFIALAIATAQRPAHLLELTWDRVRFADGVIDFQDPSRKRTKKVRPVVPMCPALQSFLIEQKSIGHVLQRHGRRLRSHRMLFTRLARAAKVIGSAYGIRKATATYLRAQGIPEMELKGILGHSLRGPTERYAKADPKRMTATRDACEALLRELNAGWLRRFTSQSLTSAGSEIGKKPSESGAGKEARTPDLNLGKGCTNEDFRHQKAANDD